MADRFARDVMNFLSDLLDVYFVSPVWATESVNTSS